MQQKLNQLATSSAVAANNNATSPAGGNSIRNGSIMNKNNNGSNNNSSNPILERLENDILRMRRTTNLLILVGVIFCVGWLPLNIFNTVMDITEKDRIDEQGKKVKPFLTDEQYYIFYAVCHMTGMVSACANPVIYGYLNENFNREFRELFRVGRGCCCRGSGDKSSQTVGGPGRKSLVIKKQADKDDRQSLKGKSKPQVQSLELNNMANKNSKRNSTAATPPAIKEEGNVEEDEAREALLDQHRKQEQNEREQNIV